MYVGIYKTQLNIFDIKYLVLSCYTLLLIKNIGNEIKLNFTKLHLPN